MHAWRLFVVISIFFTTVVVWQSTPLTTVDAKAGPALSAQLVQPRVIGGAPADTVLIGGYAYITIASEGPPSKPTSGGGRCNGALIHPEWVVTTAYCLVDFDAALNSRGLVNKSRVKVDLGCYTRINGCKPDPILANIYNTTAQTNIAVDEVIVHPLMVYTNNIPNPAYGVVLLKLSKPAQLNVGIMPLPIALASDDMDAERQPQVVSFGDYRRIIATITPALKTPTATLPPTPIPASEFTEGTGTLRTAPIQIISDGACTLPGFVGATLWCANPSLVGTDICKGDTGAPLVSSVNGQMVLFGLNLTKKQFGLTACAENTQSALVDVTSAPIRDWISSTITTKSPKSLRKDFGGVVGFGSTVLPQGDDILQKIDISDIFTRGLKIGATTSSVVSIANDGVVALGDVQALPQNLPQLKQWIGAPLIAVFAADVDTRNSSMRPVTGSKSTGSNRVWIAKDVVNRQVTITWDDVRPYPQTSRVFLSNSFQVQIRAQTADITTVTFTYDTIQWTYGENSCGRPCRYATAQHAQVGIATGMSTGTWTHLASGNADKLRALAQSKTVYIADGKISETLPVIRPTATGGVVRTATSVPTTTPVSVIDGVDTDGLLAWYPLNGIRTTGSTLPVQATTLMGDAQYFDGVNDYHQTSIDLANKSFTVAFWAAHNGTPGSDSGTRSMAIGAGSDADRHKAFQIFFTGKYVLCSDYDSVAVFDAPNTFDVTEWHHYACIYNISTTTVDLVVDGVLVASGTFSQPLQTTSTFWIGRPPWNYDYFKGMLRDVMVYDRPLTVSEINRIKNYTPNNVMISEPHPASACRWIDKRGNIHEYEINHDLLTWDQAKTAAESRIRGGQKGYLATITSAVENECVAQLVQLYAGGYPWVGGSDAQIEGTWKWMTGPETGMNINKTTGYENWGGPQPDNCCGGEHYLNLIYSGGGWNDSQALYKDKSIIEYTYQPDNAITGITFADANKNKRRDAQEAIVANVPITLTAELAQPVDIVGGGNQLCARLDDGRAVCWGRRGDAWRWDQQSAVPIEVDGWRDVRAISNGVFTSCALLGNGTVSCLGKNSNGAVGDGTTTDRWTPVLVSGITNAVALNSGGGYHHCAVLADGKVRCWGDNTYGQLGDGTSMRRTTPVLVSGLSGVGQVSVGEQHTCALKTDKTVWCWGSNTEGQLAVGVGIQDSPIPRQIVGLSGVKDVKSGSRHVCVIRSDNQVACWGNPTGINGNRSVVWITSPTVIENTTNTVSLSVGNEQSCVAKSAGTVWCWGHVFHGEAGWVASGTTTTRRSSAVQIPSVSNITQVALSKDSACGRRANGDVLCWGEASVGQLGDGTYQPRGIANYVRVTWQTNPYAARVATMASSWQQRCAILTDRRVACWGSKHVWFPPSSGYKSDTTLEPGIIPGLQDIVDLYMGPSMSCALQRTGRVWCWGNKMVVSQFINGVADSDIPQLHVLTNVTAISHGGSAVTYCFTQSSNSAKCYAAYSTVDSYQIPTSGTVSDAGQVSSGHLSSCVLLQSTGQVKCWGDNSYFGQLGIGYSNLQTSTLQASITNMSTVQALSQNGSYANCALLADSSVKCWGQAIVIDGVNWGNAGSGGSSAYATPVAIPDSSGMRQLSTGIMTCGVKFDGTVWCWGVPKWEDIPTGSMTPWQISGMTDAVSVNVSADANATTCVLRTNGEMRCWGVGSTGMLGDGTSSYRSIHRPISEPWQANVSQGCEWVDVQGQRHYYESLYGAWTWTQARDMAATRTWRGTNGYLATITSPEENRCVHQLFMRQPAQGGQWPAMTRGWYPRQWLGGSDAESEGTWKWLTGPEAGTTFRRNLGRPETDIQPGYSQFDNTSDACKPDCESNPSFVYQRDYLQLMLPKGAYTQRNQWNDEQNIDSPVGALVEYTTSPGETARSYTMTSDAQGRYTFGALTPGKYRITVRTPKGLSEQLVFINDIGRTVMVDLNVTDIIQPIAGTQTITPSPTTTPTKYLIPTGTASMTPTASRTFTPSMTRSLTRTLSPTASNTPLPRPIFSTFGDGHDFTLNLANGETRYMPDYAQIRTAASAISAGATTIALNASCSGFVNNNDEVLIHQTQGGAPGTYEYALVKTCNGTTLTLWDATTKSYTVSSGVVQVLKVHNFIHVNGASSSLVAAPWNGSMGGILVFKASGDVVLNTLSVDASGFRGGSRGAFGAPDANGEQGESVTVGRSRTNSRNALAGGGGRGDNGAGGGGSGGGGASHLVRGAAGTKGQGGGSGEVGASLGDLAGTYGSMTDYHTRIVPASGGGGGGANDGTSHYGGYGGTGAGVIMITARGITITRITAAGASGTNAAFATGSGEGGGGGGAGGSMFVRGSRVVLGEVSLWGGSGGLGRYANGGYGADGYAQVEYCQTVQISTVTGRTTGSIVPGYATELCP